MLENGKQPNFKPYIGGDGRGLIFVELKEAVKYVRQMGDTPIMKPEDYHTLASGRNN